MLKTVAVIGGSSRHGRSPAHIDAARQLGCLLRSCGYSIVCSGGRNGIVGATLDEYGACGLKTTAIILSGSTEMGELHDSVSEIKAVESTAGRKRLLRELSMGIVALPGGVGTLEEIFAFAFEKRQGMLLGPLILIDVEEYFLPLRYMMEAATGHGFLGLHAGPELLTFTTSAADALAVLAGISN